MNKQKKQGDRRNRYIKQAIKTTIDDYFKKSPGALTEVTQVVIQECPATDEPPSPEIAQRVEKAMLDYFRDHLAEKFHIDSPKAYIEHYFSFPGHSKMPKDFDQVIKKMRLKPGDRKKLATMIDAEKWSRSDEYFYFKVFIPKLNSSQDLQRMFSNIFMMYFRRCVAYVMMAALKHAQADPKLYEELYRVPLYFDQFFREEEGAEMNVSIPHQGINNATAIVLKKPRGATKGTPARKLIATDLFTTQRIRGGLSERHITIIEAACALYDKKIRHGEKPGFTICELADLIGKNKKAGGEMYKKMIVDFTDLYNMRFHDGEGFIRLFVETKILGKAGQVLFFDGENQNELLERCIFHITPEASSVIEADKIFFFQNSEYFRLEPFMKFIARKVSSTVTRNRNFQAGVIIGDHFRLSLGSLTEDSGIGFDYSQPKRELKKLIDIFNRAVKKGILKEFSLTVKVYGQHTAIDEQSAVNYKQIAKNRDDMFFNFSPGDELKLTLQGGLKGHILGNNQILG